jgi:xanthine dehydrogenase accessory factor
MLFHDHDWEIELLAQALTLRTFFIGAMGSRETHERRLAELRQNGVPDELSRRIVAPVGMIRSARDPDTLALSILSQVVDAHREMSATSGEAKPVHHLEALGFPHYRLA